jgi:hypothetical protein
MVSDYAIKSIALVDFLNITGIAIAVPFLREIQRHVNTRLLSNLPRSLLGSRRKGCACDCSFGREFCVTGVDSWPRVVTPDRRAGLAE